MRALFFFILSFFILIAVGCKDDSRPSENLAPTEVGDATGKLGGVETGDADSGEKTDEVDPKFEEKPPEKERLKDSDGDGVIDLADDCPYVRGKKCLSGCTEKDNDCIPDEVDACPETDGLPSLNGCPEKAPEDKKIYYADFDGDGLGDPAVSKESKYALPNHTTNNNDNCPTRKGSEDNNGCPEVVISSPDKDLFINEEISFGIKESMSKSDTYHWYTSGNVIVNNASTLNPTFKFSSIGKYIIQLEIKNETEKYYSGKITKTVFLKVKDQYFSNLFDPLIEYGNIATLAGKMVSPDSTFTISDELKEDVKNSEIRIRSYLEGGNISIYKKGLSGNTFENLVDELMSPKRSKRTRIEKINISNIKYSESTGRITSFDYVFK